MRHTPHSGSLVTRPLGPRGLHRTLFAALRAAERDLGYLCDFIGIASEYHGLPPQRT